MHEVRRKIYGDPVGRRTPGQSGKTEPGKNGKGACRLHRVRRGYSLQPLRGGLSFRRHHRRGSRSPICRCCMAISARVAACALRNARDWRFSRFISIIRRPLLSWNFPTSTVRCPEEGDTVPCGDRKGDYVTEGRVISVKNAKVNDGTAVVGVEIPKAYCLEVRTICRKENRRHG